MNEIFDYFDSLKGKSLLIPMEYSEYEVVLKFKRYNFFTKYFKNKYLEKVVQFVWKSLIFIQKQLNIKRNKRVNYIKASNWVSISKKHIDLILNNERSIIKQYKYSFCGDEFFIPSLLLNNNCLDEVVFNDNFLKCGFIRANSKVFTMDDYDELINSNAFFARKFSDKNLDVLLRLLKRIRNEEVY
jgi:Core-2/I-Branching enzyme.